MPDRVERTPMYGVRGRRACDDTHPRPQCAITRAFAGSDGPGPDSIEAKWPTQASGGASGLNTRAAPPPPRLRRGSRPSGRSVRMAAALFRFAAPTCPRNIGALCLHAAAGGGSPSLSLRQPARAVLALRVSMLPAVGGHPCGHPSPKDTLHDRGGLGTCRRRFSARKPNWGFPGRFAGQAGDPQTQIGATSSKNGACGTNSFFSTKWPPTHFRFGDAEPKRSRRRTAHRRRERFAAQRGSFAALPCETQPVLCRAPGRGDFEARKRPKQASTWHCQKAEDGHVCKTA